MDWADGLLASALIRSDLGRRCVIKTDVRIRITSSGQEVLLDLTNPGHVVFETTPGAVYRVEVIH
jgi:hypothetical protein